MHFDKDTQETVFDNLLDAETGQAVRVACVVTPEMEKAHDRGHKAGVAFRAAYGSSA